MALPGDPAQPAQVVDCRDLDRLVVRLVEDDRGGAYTAVGPEEPITLGGLVHLCARGAGTDVTLVPVPEVAYPLVRPRPAWPSQQRSAAKARAAGLTATPLDVTIADVLAWDRARGEPPPTVGFTPAEEAALLAP